MSTPIRILDRDLPQGVALMLDCCDLSAMLPWLLHNDDVSLEDARRLWQDLRAQCPNDLAAHRYIELGLREFAGPTAN